MPFATTQGPAPSSSVRVPSGLGWLRLLLVLAVLVPLLLLAAFSVYRYAQLEAEAEVRLKRTLSIAHEHALRILATNRTLLEHVRDLAPRGTALDPQRRDELNAQLAQLARGQPQVQSIRIEDPNGAVLAASDGLEPRPGADGVGRGLTPEPQLMHGRVHLSDLLRDGPDGERLFEISLGRFTKNGDFAGVVETRTPPSFFTSFHATLAAEEPGVAITLFRADGLVYSRWPPLPDAPERMSPRGEVLSRVLAGETSGVVRNISSLDQQRRIILFQQLGDFPAYIGVGREFGALKMDLLREVGLLAAFGAVPVLGIVLAAWVAMQRTRQALAAAAELRHESEVRRQVEEALFQSQKMEALGRLTGGVAHDFNNALMVIGGNLHLLHRTVPEGARRYLDAIGRAVQSSAQLTRQLLAFSRRQALAPENVRLQERLPELEDLLVPTLGAQVQLSIDVDPATPPIHVDASELELALINLAVNARDAMDDGGSFILRAGPTPAPAGADGEWVLVEAVDSGQGMDPAVAARAFDPFFTTKPAGKGTGLGLSQVYGLCERAGGRAELRSAPGRGTRVRLLFPASREADPPAPPVPADASAPLKLSVLLVEDNLEVAQVIRPVLESHGCTVMHVPTGALALKVLEVDAGRFDLLLTDVVMPGGVDGATLASTVQIRYPRLQILLMTGYAEQIAAIDALGFKVLAKPFTPQVLTEALASIVRTASAPPGTRPPTAQGHEGSHTSL
ncbi:response regulator [Ramlibacter sp. AW1]|uniref:histidine kinase n=1 Tax=Ramlibacter aurantiacus TaxID=2801330 RepID=A0A937CZW4_9BURK|nr:hybrid sensor histidine kinase/response regulator [Ramlibacter aurantiacus]MBL0418789.1 response regulator [Ramlibacter aurantiacus]